MGIWFGSSILERLGRKSIQNMKDPQPCQESVDICDNE